MTNENGRASSLVNDNKAPTVKPDNCKGGVSVEHGMFRCRRGVDLYTTTYTPAVRRTSACLVFHHGLSDHAARHANVLSHLCATLGMPTYTYDAHGHGRSGPDGPVGRALIRSFDHVVDDLLDFTRNLVVPAEAAAAKVTAAPMATTTAGKHEHSGNGTPGVSGDAKEAAAAAATNGGGARGEGASWRPRIYLLGYSMGGLTCCLAMAATCGSSCDTSSSSCSSYSTGVAATTAEPGCKQGPEAPATRNGLYPAAASTAATAAGVNSGAGANGCSNGNGHGSGSSSSSLYEGLMLTSCLTDPLYGKHPVVQYMQVAYVTLLSWLIPTVPVFKRNPVESGIRDPAAVVEMAADTLWYRGSFKVATVASLLWGCQRLRAVCRRLASVPLYVQHATVDVACSLASMRAFLARVRPADLTMHVVEAAYHDLHHDPETPALLGHMVAWLRKRV